MNTLTTPETKTPEYTIDLGKLNSEQAIVMGKTLDKLAVDNADTAAEPIIKDLAGVVRKAIRPAIQKSYPSLAREVKKVDIDTNRVTVIPVPRAEAPIVEGTRAKELAYLVLKSIEELPADHPDAIVLEEVVDHVIPPLQETPEQQ